MNNPQVAKQIAKLKDENEAVRRNAIEALGEIGTPAIPALLEALADADLSLRLNAVNALGKIRDSAAVPALIAALKDQDAMVRHRSAYALREIRDASAVPALIEALKDDPASAAYALGMIGAPALPALIHALEDPDASVRRYALEALAMIGTFALPALMNALKGQDETVRRDAAKALMRNGDSETLPRKILAEARWSAQERIDVLEELRRVRFNRLDITLFYRFPETHVLCQTVLKEQDVAARAGAQEVLNWLSLLRASQSDTRNQSQELVRPAQGREIETKPETLLRIAHEPEKEVEPSPVKPTIWQRLFGKRRSAS